jgi:hypothetical protein
MSLWAHELGKQPCGCMCGPCNIILHPAPIHACGISLENVDVSFTITVANIFWMHFDITFGYDRY